ncbi:MAG: SDR family NAD(P)-dependent oxidoreductase [Desmonostoc geniculatum HA4340-LM1]|nr:SDR family NAD(P)-dependent oxidoreductase [Desmonostoc geniculatum HA4340-LM1]
MDCSTTGGYLLMSNCGDRILKIVISLQEPDVTVAPSSQATVTFHPDATYLITGGLGGFGLAVAQWLVKGGARHLVLMGRSGADSSVAKEAVKTLESADVRVVVAKADVSHEEEVKSVLANISQSMPPLRGIIHAAMVLDDALLLDLNQERLAKAIAPKAMGAWNLHTHTLNAPLDFFVSFSSFSSIIGNAGQGNYVAANTFLDTLAHHRRALGLPALTVNWGAIADVGSVADNTVIGQYLDQMGMKGLRSHQALQILGQLLRVEAVQTGVTPFNWQRLSEIYPTGASARFSQLVNEAALLPKADRRNSKGDLLLDDLMTAQPTERCPISVFGGIQDKVITEDFLSAWREQTRSKFQLQMLSGNHLFLHSDRQLLLQAISEDISSLIEFVK